MKISILHIAVIYLVLFFTLSSGSTNAQEKKDKSCCSATEKVTEKPDHTELQQKMNSLKASDENTINSADTADRTIVKLEAWNEVCPVKGNKVDPQTHLVSYHDKVYGFCCNGCDAKFTKDPLKYSKNLSEDGKSYVGTE